MAYKNTGITFNAGDADIRIQQFKGLLQYGSKIGGDLRYAPYEVNVETTGGDLQPAAMPFALSAQLTKPIGTLTALYRRWYTGTGSKTLLVAASDHKLYAMAADGTAWTQLSFPSGVTAYSTDTWSFVSYEINVETVVDGETVTVTQDVLLLSNADDGMVMVNGDTLAVTAVDTPKKFGVITRYAERIWGGAITDEPDMLVYSAPYDPTDWNKREPDATPSPGAPDWTLPGEPEDGAGDILQPSWDGDSFTALIAYGSQLIAFKRTRVWRILGTDPGEYTFKEQFGGGTPFARTAALFDSMILMLDKTGPSYYDGTVVQEFMREYAWDIWQNLDPTKQDGAVGCVWRGKYYVSFSRGTAGVNDTVIIYDSRDGTWLMRTDLNIASFLPTEDALYMTSSVQPGKVFTWEENAFDNDGTISTDWRWVTPWCELLTKRYTGGPCDIMFTAEAKDTTFITVALRTERKEYYKPVKIKASDDNDQPVARRTRVHFPDCGQRFQIAIRAREGYTTPIRITGGIHMVVDTENER